jgi:hypothetical protein
LPRKKISATAELKPIIEVRDPGGTAMQNDQHEAIIDRPRNVLATADWRRVIGPLLVAVVIILCAIVAVEKFDLSAQWATMSAGAGIALAALWLI